MNISMKHVKRYCEDAESDMRELHAVFVVKEISKTSLARNYVCRSRAIAIIRKIESRFQYEDWEQERKAKEQDNKA